MGNGKTGLLLMTPAALLMLWLAGCSLHRDYVETPQPTSTSVSSQAAEDLEARLRQVASLLPGQAFEIDITESEISSYWAVNYPEAFYREVQVQITPGQFHIEGLLVEPVRCGVDILCTVSASDDNIYLDLDRTVLGCFSLPPFLLRSLSSRATEILDKALADFSITDLNLQAGSLHIVGYRSGPKSSG